MNILNLFLAEEIDKDEMLIIYTVKENKEVEIKDLGDILKDFINLKSKLENLYSKNLINIDWNKNKIYDVSEIKKEENIPEANYLNVNSLDKIRGILNREITNYELEMIKKWHKTYTIEQIIGAIYKTILKNIDNFKYIEKVLINEENYKAYPQESTTANKVTKNFDFFS